MNVRAVWMYVTAALAISAGAVLTVIFIFGPEPAVPLPPKIQAQLERHQVATAVDTATTHRLERDTAAAGRRQRAAAALQATAEARAQAEKTRADSLDLVAAQALTARDSAIAYHAALDASQRRGDQLEGALAQSGRQLFAAGERQAQTDSIADVWKAHAFRADSLVTTLVDVATHPAQCRIAWVLKCPSRGQAFVGGVVLGAVGYAIATGKIKIPAALKF